MGLPDNTNLILPQNRSTDGYYKLHPGETKIFVWQVKPMSSTNIVSVHAWPGSQDWSIAAWYSSSPLDNILFPSRADLNWHLPRVAITHSFWDNLISGLPIGTLQLPINTLFYFNVRNCCNEHNTFKATFSF